MGAPFALSFELTFAEALAQAKARGVVLPAVYYGDLQREARSRAFTVSGMTSADQIAGVLESLQRSLGEGKLFRDWKREQLATLEGLPPSRAETIYRNAVQTAYSVGRTTQQREHKGRRPYLMWDAINDGRTRPTHRAMDGHIAPIDDPIWQKWSPPAGHRCRCTRIALTEEQARRRGYPKAPPNVEPDAGWDYEKADGDGGLPGKAAKKAARAGVKAPAPPNNLPTSGFVPQATTKAAAEWARAQNLADTVDFGKIKPEVANALNQSLFEHLQEFPELRPSQKFVGTGQAQFEAYHQKAIADYMATLRAHYAGKLSEQSLRGIAEQHIKRPKVSGVTYAHSWAQKDVSGIGVNEKFGRDPADMNSKVKLDTITGWHPAGSASIKAIFDHEFGHQLDDLLDLTRTKAIPEIEQEWKAFQALSETDRRAQLSGYGGKNRAEFVAEAWTEYRNNPKPRPIAIKIGELIRSRYRLRYP